MNMLLIIFLLFLALIVLIVLNNIEVVNVSMNNNADKMVSVYDNIQGTCADTHFGCCPDGVNSKMNIFGSNCPGYKPQPQPQPQPQPKPIGGCAGTIYGCCPDNVTPKISSTGANCQVKK